MLIDVAALFSALTHSVLVFLLLAVKRRQFARTMLIILGTGMIIWSLLHTSVVQPIGTFLLPSQLSAKSWLGLNYLFADGIKYVVVSLFLAACVTNQFNSLRGLLRCRSTYLFTLMPASLMLLATTAHGGATLVAILVALQTLIVLELIYRQAVGLRWAYKPLLMYLGVGSVIDFIGYVSSLLHPELTAYFLIIRTLMQGLMLPLLVLTIRRMSHWDIKIFVSREIVLHSTLLFFAGLYMLAVGVLAYFVRLLPDSMSQNLGWFSVVSSLLVLVVVLLSKSYRNQIDVFITKHFFANQFDYRVEWVKLSSALAQFNPQQHRVHAYALEKFLLALGKHRASLYRINANRQLVHLAGAQLTSSDQQSVQPLVNYALDNEWIVDTVELKNRPKDYPNVHIDPVFLAQFPYQLLVPFDLAERGQAIMMVDMEHTGKRVLNFELRDYIVALRIQLQSFILQHEQAEELAQSAQFAAFSRMSAYVIHDLKNVMAQIDLILQNAQAHKHNPEFIDDAFDTLTHTQQRMNKMLSLLSNKTRHSSAADMVRFDLGELLNSLIDSRCKRRSPLPQIEVLQPISPVMDKERLGNVLFHLIDNAQHAAYPDGSVKIIVDGLEPERFCVKIIDTGCGMTSEFIATQLFSPFVTTKGNAGMGIGAYDAKTFIEGLGGTLLVDSEVGQGTEFCIMLPIEAGIPPA